MSGSVQGAYAVKRKLEPIALSEAEFAAIRDLMYAQTGVFLRPSKKHLVITRLRKRLEALRMDSFQAYLALLREKSSAEMEEFVNAITTNETYFFRHTKQFNYLFERVLPQICQNGAKQERMLRVWSAACSTGEEPYSLAIAVHEFFKQRPGWNWRVFASDVNSSVLESARNGRYAERSLRFTPQALRKRYFQEIELGDRFDRRAGFEISEQIRQRVTFSQHNLLKPFTQRDMDIIFLRNVMIYFEQPTKEQVVHILQKNLLPGGYLFVGLSENLNNIPDPLEYENAGIYRKQ